METDRSKQLVTEYQNALERLDMLKNAKRFCINFRRCYWLIKVATLRSECPLSAETHQAGG